MHEKSFSQVVIRIDPALHRAFRHAVIDDDTSLKEVMENAIDGYLRTRSGYDLRTAPAA